MCLQGGVMIVHGGYDGKQTFGDTWKLSTADWTWQQVATKGKYTCIHVVACGVIARLGLFASSSRVADDTHYAASLGRAGFLKTELFEDGWVLSR